MKTVLIIGANSAIAKATARLYAEEQCQLYLLGRDTAALAEQKKDLEIRGATSVDYAPLDVTHFAVHEAVIEQALDTLGHIDIVLLCHGSLPDQALCEIDFDATREAFTVNALSVISLLTTLAQKMQSQGNGTIAVVTSVAGDRGRKSNYIYGSAKGMVSIYLQGLRGRLFKDKVNVIDIKPGFVDTPMTSHIKKGPLWASPEQVATCITTGISKNKHTVYAPYFWRYIMQIVCNIPESLFKKLNF